MKTILFLICFGCVALPDARAQAVLLAKVDLTQVARGTLVYRIQDGEVTVGGNVIKRVEIGKTTAVITYFNKTNSNQQPKFHFRLINAYGLEVAKFDDKWLLHSISAGQVQKENKDVFLHELNCILQFSGISLPADWASPVYLIIEGMQP